MWKSKSMKTKETSMTKRKSVPLKLAASDESSGSEEVIMNDGQEFFPNSRISDISISSIQLQGMLDSIPTSPNASSNRNISFVLPGGNDSIGSITHDHEKTQEELLLKVSKLMDKLRQTELDHSAEKVIRKKKEKSLMKLAKELKKRNQQKDIDSERLEKAEAKAKELEHEVILARKETKQQRALNEEHLKEYKLNYQRTLAEAKEKYAQTCAEHDVRITELSKSHANQCDELCREILKANLEADCLRSQLGNRMGEHSLRTAVPFSKAKMTSKVDSFGKFLFLLLSILFGVSVVVGNQFGVHDSLCAPAMPGTVLNGDSPLSSLVAPWWAPTSTKGTFHSILCGDGRSRLDWFPDKVETKLKVTNDKHVVWYKKLTAAKVQSDRIVLEHQRGRSEEVKLVRFPIVPSPDS